MAFEKCDLTASEKIVLKTYFEFITEFNDRDTYDLLTQLLLERLEAQVARACESSLRLSAASGC